MPKINLPMFIKQPWQRIALPMMLIEQTRGLRDFAWQFSIMLIVVFMGLLPWLFSGVIPIWPLLVAGYLMVSAVIYPKAIYPVYVVWMVIASILGFINTQILLALVYFLVFAPVGCILRLTKGLQYQHKRSKKLNSYYIKRDKPLDKDHLTKPF
ncbi:MAG: SxtJ family membrane protein [Glaciecola sp.]|nr:SxtJ family membrane protein [Glaciecola sp.]MDG1814913.1 SxtJ family membrane protein [Glaciecola sp.]MDG2100177.1 SxtJ family membrane protein [Glaciecola sp.]